MLTKKIPVENRRNTQKSLKCRSTFYQTDCARFTENWGVLSHSEQPAKFLHLVIPLNFATRKGRKVRVTVPSGRTGLHRQVLQFAKSAKIAVDKRVRDATA